VLAVNTSAVDPLPHQITAVYETMLGRQAAAIPAGRRPGRRQDDHGGPAHQGADRSAATCDRCLIVSPGSLAEQWQDELDRKVFNLPFEILTNEGLKRRQDGQLVSGNTTWCIARLDKLSAKRGRSKQKLAARLPTGTWWSVDEAHKMSATYVRFGETKYTKRYQAWDRCCPTLMLGSSCCSRRPRTTARTRISTCSYGAARRRPL
jgi:hypothetical protein